MDSYYQIKPTFARIVEHAKGKDNEGPENDLLRANRKFLQPVYRAPDNAVLVELLRAYGRDKKGERGLEALITAVEMFYPSIHQVGYGHRASRRMSLQRSRDLKHACARGRPAYYESRSREALSTIYRGWCPSVLSHRTRLTNSASVAILIFPCSNIRQ